MGIFIGGTEIKDIKIGSTAINKVFIGANQVWSRNLDQQTVTVGNILNMFYGKVFASTSPNAGSVSDGTCNFKSGAIINELNWFSGNVQFGIDGSHSNSGFNTMTINGANFTRSNATFYQYSTRTVWQWSNVSTNPFGTTVGATKTVTWT